MEEIKYLIFARGSGKNIGQLVKAAEEERQRIAEEERKELIKKYAISEKEREILRGVINQLEEQLPKLRDLEELKEIPRRSQTPEEIKRRLKYAKNPMEIQQLNRQLAKAYKEWGRKKH